LGLSLRCVLVLSLKKTRKESVPKRNNGKERINQERSRREETQPGPGVVFSRFFN